MSARSALTSSCLARSLAQARSCNDRKLRAAQRSLTSSQRCASSCGCSATHRAHPDSFAGASTDAAPTPPLAMTPCSHPVAIHPVYRNPESVSSDAAARRCHYKSGLHPTNERLLSSRGGPLLRPSCPTPADSRFAGPKRGLPCTNPVLPGHGSPRHAMGRAEADAQAQNLILDAYRDGPVAEASPRKGPGRPSRIGLEDRKPGSRNWFRGLKDHPFYRRRQACRRYSSRPVTMTCRTRTTTQA